MNYLPDKETTFEKTVQTSEANLLMKIVIGEAQKGPWSELQKWIC